MLGRTIAGAFALWLFSGSTSAFGVEDYREITLTDGRVFVGEVIATEAGGLRTKLPQGTLLVPYHHLQDMVPANAEKFARQQQWLMYVLGTNESKVAMRQALNKIPGVQMYGDTGTEGALNSIHLSAARQCKGDIVCVSKALDPGYWLWVVSVDAAGAGVMLRGSLNTNESVYEIELDSLRTDGLVPAMYEMIGLDPLPNDAAPTVASSEGTGKANKAPKAPKQPKAPKPAKEPKAPKVAKAPKVKSPKQNSTDAKVFGMSFVPLPGYPSLAQGDAGGFALSMAVVIPATVGWIGATGKNAQSAPEHAAMSIGGFYVATVAINQLFGMRTKNRRAKVAVGVQPATKRGDGTMVQLTMPLK
jgi:hypothetical protein